MNTTNTGAGSDARLSVRKIARTLNDHFDLGVCKSTVYHWMELLKKAIDRKPAP